MASGVSRQRAHEFAKGLTGTQILAKLAKTGVDHPAGLAQSIGVSGKGTKTEVSRRIATHMKSCKGKGNCF